MQEETTQKTIALAIKTSKLTASVLQKAMKMYLEHQKHKEPSHGKMILSILVDTFISKISFPMQPGPEIGSISDA